jgi:hypothetical protein
MNKVINWKFVQNQITKYNKIADIQYSVHDAPP